MEMAQAPSLEELGLQAGEQRQLAKIGVRNGAQLRNLQRSAGEETLMRQRLDTLARRYMRDLRRTAFVDVRV